MDNMDSYFVAVCIYNTGNATIITPVFDCMLYDLNIKSVR